MKIFKKELAINFYLRGCENTGLPGGRAAKPPELMIN
jgi:hypothetical protein